MYADRLPGTDAWTTKRTFGLSTPIPNAVVAAITSSSSSMNASWAFAPIVKRVAPSVVKVMVSEKAKTVPAGEIVDRPRFAWRGAMLDVARHFFTVDEVKQYIDVLALYKMNVFHFHVTDNPGWRVECRSHPELNDPKFQTPTRRPGCE